MALCTKEVYVKALVIEDEIFAHHEAVEREHDKREKRRRLAIPLDQIGERGWLTIIPNRIMTAVISGGPDQFDVDGPETGLWIRDEHSYEQPKGVVIREVTLHPALGERLVAPYIAAKLRASHTLVIAELLSVFHSAV